VNTFLAAKPGTLAEDAPMAFRFWATVDAHAGFDRHLPGENAAAITRQGELSAQDATGAVDLDLAALSVDALKVREFGGAPGLRPGTPAAADPGTLAPAPPGGKERVVPERVGLQTLLQLVDTPAGPPAGCQVRQPRLRLLGEVREARTWLGDGGTDEEKTLKFLAEKYGEGGTDGSPRK
jgi:hypothetical protein